MYMNVIGRVLVTICKYDAVLSFNVSFSGFVRMWIASIVEQISLGGKQYSYGLK